MRRAIDITVAAALLIMSAPLVMTAMAVIYMSDRHNPIFSQIRLGQHEEPFTLYKLRTMSPGTPSVASHQLNQSSLTPAGRVLRRLKLDELPQLVNVLRGEMALVGPRPGLPDHDQLTEARRAHDVFDSLPGITGLAQVRGVDMSEPEQLAKTDREYIDGRSTSKDLTLLANTVLGGGRGDALGSQQ